VWVRIVVFEVEPHEAQAFERLRSHHELALTPAALDAENAADFAEAQIISTFIFSSLDKAVLEKLPALRMIATRSTGFDHIDLSYCDAHDITVANVPTYGENTVAEHVFALLLTISHRILDAVERARRGPFSPRGLEGFDLKGRTLGVIGTGNIGSHVIRIARGFEMDVLAYDIAPNETLARQLAFQYLPFDEVLARADVLTLHVPASAETKNLIGEREFARMKPGALLINTARGSVVDVGALVAALNTGKVAAAGLDVLPDEPLIREEAELIASAFSQPEDLRKLLASHVLLRMPNVVVTPHSAFNTREAVARIVETTLENIEAFSAGRPQNIVAA
jgi:D-lactate dehydrogenase